MDGHQVLSSAGREAGMRAQQEAKRGRTDGEVGTCSA